MASAPSALVRRQLGGEREQIGQTFHIAFSDPSAVSSDDPHGEAGNVVVLDLALRRCGRRSSPLVDVLRSGPWSVNS